MQGLRLSKSKKATVTLAVTNLTSMDLLNSIELLMQTPYMLEAGIIGTLVRILITAAVLLACAYLFPGVTIEGFGSALVLAVIVGILVWILSIFNFGWLNNITFGLWSLVITAVALILADKLMDSVKLDSFLWALAVAGTLALVNGLLGPTVFSAL